MMTTIHLQDFPPAPHWGEWKQDGEHFDASVVIGLVEGAGDYVGTDLGVRLSRNMALTAPGILEVAGDTIRVGDHEFTVEQAEELVRLVAVALRATQAAPVNA